MEEDIIPTTTDTVTDTEEGRDVLSITDAHTPDAHTPT
jgi:hypothetical protein